MYADTPGVSRYAAGPHVLTISYELGFGATLTTAVSSQPQGTKVCARRFLPDPATLTASARFRPVFRTWWRMPSLTSLEYQAVGQRPGIGYHLPSAMLGRGQDFCGGKGRNNLSDVARPPPFCATHLMLPGSENRGARRTVDE